MKEIEVAKGREQTVGGSPEDYYALRLKAALTFLVYRIQEKV
jgi:hypothetical protein